MCNVELRSHDSHYNVLVACKGQEIGIRYSSFWVLTPWSHINVRWYTQVRLWPKGATWNTVITCAVFGPCMFLLVTIKCKHFCQFTLYVPVCSTCMCVCPQMCMYWSNWIPALMLVYTCNSLGIKCALESETDQVSRDRKVCNSVGWREIEPSYHYKQSWSKAHACCCILVLGCCTSLRLPWYTVYTVFLSWGVLSYAMEICAR